MTRRRKQTSCQHSLATASVIARKYIACVCERMRGRQTPRAGGVVAPTRTSRSRSRRETNLNTATRSSFKRKKSNRKQLYGEVVAGSRRLSSHSKQLSTRGKVKATPLTYSKEEKGAAFSL